jgi:hypothetical protein
MKHEITFFISCAVYNLVLSVHVSKVLKMFKTQIIFFKKTPCIPNVLVVSLLEFSIILNEFGGGGKTKDKGSKTVLR